MLRSSLLTVVAALLVLPGDALVTSLCSAGVPSVLSRAQAADFTGRVRNIRIKKRRVGSGFRVVTQTAGEFGGVASVQTTLRVAGAPDGVLDEVTAQSHANTRVVAFGPDDSGISEGDVVTVLLSRDPEDDFDWEDGDDGYSTEERTRLEVAYNGDVSEAQSEDGRRVRVRVNRHGALRVVLTHDDGSWDPASVGSIGYVVEGQRGTRTAVDEVRQRWVTDVRADLTDYDVVSVETTLLDAQGAVVDTLLETSSLTGLPAPGLDSVAVRENRRGEAKLVTWTTSEGGPARLSVNLTDAETGQTMVSAVDNTPAFTERTYTYEGLEFEPGESPMDFIYLCLIDVLSAEGDPFGEQYEVELRIPALSEGEEFSVDVASFADGAGSVSFLNTGDQVHVVGALWSDDAAQAESFNLIFEEPFEGPAPLELEVNAQLVSQRDKWVQTGAIGEVGDYALAATLTTVDGELLDTMRASGSGTGSVKEGEIVAGTVVTVGDKEVLLNIGF